MTKPRKQPQTSKLVHPVQPIGFDPHDVVRFKENEIVRFLLDAASCGYKFDLNNLAVQMQIGGDCFPDGPLIDGPYNATLNKFDKVPFRVPSKPFSKADYTQLMQLIGYSTSGFGELSSVDKEIVRRADEEADRIWNAAKGDGE